MIAAACAVGVTRHRARQRRIRDIVEDWKHRLLLLQETLEEWLQCQRGWMYLETIFSAPDITKQMPVEAAAFQDVDSKWKAIMKVCETPGTLS